MLGEFQNSDATKRLAEQLAQEAFHQPTVGGATFDAMVKVIAGYMDGRDALFKKIGELGSEAKVLVPDEIKETLSEASKGVKKCWDTIAEGSVKVIHKAFGGKKNFEEFKELYTATHQIGRAGQDVAHFTALKKLRDSLGGKTSDEEVMRFAQTYGTFATDAMLFTGVTGAAANKLGQYNLVVNPNVLGSGPFGKFTLERKVNVGKTDSSVWQGLKPHKDHIKTNGEIGKKARFFEWDHTHNDIEVYGPGGRKHLGSMNPLTGEMYKGPVPGRNIKDKF